jgi:SOS regulatory protein LexA
MLRHHSYNAATRMGQTLITLECLAKAGKRLVAGHRFPCERVKILGVVEAGWPSPAEEELLDTMSFDEYLAPNKAASYILRVSGDSMIDAGIHPGDMVLVERTSQTRDGDIVIAEVDGEWTMKYFRQQGQRVWLESANAAYPPITPQRELQVVAVVRKYA